MIEAIVAGGLAGYGVAIPVGAIAVLILETGSRRGFASGFAAGAGAASADGFYAALAAVVGTAIAAGLEPVVGPLRAAAAVVLVVIAGRGLLGLVRTRPRVEERSAVAPVGSVGGEGSEASQASQSGATRSSELAATYARFVGLTVLNPMTVIYFGALIVGLPSTGQGVALKAAFVIAAFLASLSWQSLLAAFGALLHRRASPSVRRTVSVGGYLIVIGFAARIALDLLPR